MAQTSYARRTIWAVGALLLLTGLGIFGYLGWQYIGTNLMSQHQQAQIRSDMQKQWSSGESPQHQDKEITGVALLRVPRFGPDYEMPIVRGWTEADLAQGVGMYPDGADPGQIGNFVIAGHIVTHGQPFSDFKSLQKGDKIIVETKDHIYTYELREPGDATVVNFNTEWPLHQVPDPTVSAQTPADQPYITLVTCAELFHTNMRLVTTGVLIDTQEK